MYETFYRACPNQYITRARFVGVMRTLYDPEVGDRALIRQLDSIDHIFETGKIKGNETIQCLDWRLFIVALRYVKSSDTTV